MTFDAWLRTAAKHRLLTAGEEQELARRIERGDLAAKEKLVTHNVRLVAKISRGFRGQGLELEDLFSEGVLGLVRAAEKFDYRLGYRFSTYATGWCRQAIARALADKSRAIRLPVHQADEVRRMRRVESKLAAAFECEPSTVDVAAELGVPDAHVERLKLIDRNMTSLNRPASFDADGCELGDLLPDHSGTIPSPQDAAADRARAVTLGEALADLGYRERRVIVSRFGLEDDQPRTLDEIAQRFDVTRERIRQTELGALKKLLDGRHAEALRAELEAS